MPKPTSVKDVGARIARARTRLGMSQRVLADRTGYSLSYVQKVESGARALDSLTAIARFAAALNVGLGELLGEPIQVTIEHGTIDDPAGGMEAVDLACQAGASDLGPGALEALQVAVDQLARDYSCTPPRVLAPRIRDRLRWVGRLLDGRATLAQRRELLAAGGWLAVLLAICQFDLGQRDAAEANRHAAFQLGQEIDHHQVMAWALETQAWFALFQQRFRTAAELARDGQALAPEGTSVAVQLAGQEARAWSRLGERRAAEAALARAMEALAKLPVPEHPEHHFAFDEPKLAFYAATCYVWLGDGRRAEAAARQVTAQADRDPTVAQRWPTRLATAYVELGLALALQGRIDEACAAACQAFDAPYLRSSTVWRARELDAVLLARYASVPEVRDFHERYLLARQALHAR